MAPEEENTIPPQVPPIEEISETPVEVSVQETIPEQPEETVISEEPHVQEENVPETVNETPIEETGVDTYVETPAFVPPTNLRHVNTGNVYYGSEEVNENNPDIQFADPDTFEENKFRENR